MNDNAFDEALQRVAADEKLPYASDAWTRMAARLDAHDSGKKGRGLVIPLPVLRWTAAAAVIVLALGTGWWLRDVAAPSENMSARTIAGISANTGSSARADLTQESPIPASPSVVTSSAQSPQHVGRGRQIQPARNNARPVAPVAGNGPVIAQSSTDPVVPTPAQETPTSSPEQVATADAPVITPPRSKSQQPQFDFLTPDETRKPAARTGFDVAGGYGYGGDVPAFSVGVAVRRPVSSRLQLEGALALVGTTPDPIGATVKEDNLTPTATNSGPGIAGQPPLALQEAAAAEAEYEDLRARQLFVQAAPVLMYRVAGGLSAGGGLDAQRRVSANSTARERQLNSFQGVSVPALPEWDFGLAVRADYNVTKQLRFGVQYRESLKATAADGATAKGRNYWMLQAGFRIR